MIFFSLFFLVMVLIIATGSKLGKCPNFPKDRDHLIDNDLFLTCLCLQRLFGGLGVSLQFLTGTCERLLQEYRHLTSHYTVEENENFLLKQLTASNSFSSEVLAGLILNRSCTGSLRFCESLVSPLALPCPEDIILKYLP